MPISRGGKSVKVAQQLGVWLAIAKKTDENKCVVRGEAEGGGVGEGLGKKGKVAKTTAIDLARRGLPRRKAEWGVNNRGAKEPKDKKGTKKRFVSGGSKKIGVDRRIGGMIAHRS